MKLNITREWLESFPHDEPRGYATLHDRDVQAQRQAEAEKIAEATANVTSKRKRRATNAMKQMGKAVFSEAHR